MYSFSLSDFIRDPVQSEVMGPDDSLDNTTGSKALSVPKLRADGGNWPFYQERAMNFLKSKGLWRHVRGLVLEPEEPVMRNGKLYPAGTQEDDLVTKPLSKEQLKEINDEIDNYIQKEASVKEVFYRTIDKSTFLQIKGEATAAAAWKKLVEIHAKRGDMFEMSLLAQLQNARFTEGQSM